MKIGVFDSGRGGRAVAETLAAYFPDHEIIVVDDCQNVPYGTRPNDEIITLTRAAIQPLIDSRCDVIVIACNTATAAAITILRAEYPEIPFVGLEPMIKPAATLTQTGTIAVFATPATLASERYRNLVNEWASEITILEPDCASWAGLIESGRADEIPIESFIERAIDQGADVIVLACTHYHWLKARAEDAARGTALILEPSDAIAGRVRTILDEIAQ